MSGKVNMKLKTIKTDVLVVGGGFAGVFAAVKASEAGAKVTMMVKGRIGRSGLTPWANSWFVFHETQGITAEQYMEQFKLSGEYLNNLDWSQILMDESWDRLQEMVSWGAKTGRQYYYQPGTVSRSIEYVQHGDAMRKKVVESGIDILERVMVTSLIKKDGKVVGGMGFHMESGKPYAVLANSTILCSGPSSFKPLGMGYPCSSTTSDGDVMAYRVGAEISGKEFNDAHPSRHFNPIDEKTLNSVSGDGNHKVSVLELGGGPPSAPGPEKNLNGATLGLQIQQAYGFNEGGNPIDPKYCGGPGGVDVGRPAPTEGHIGYSTVGMSNHKGEGLFPQDLYGKSNVPGLWAAGDAMCSMQNGAGYAGFGSSSSGSAVQGARSGKAAAEYSASIGEYPEVSAEELEAYKAEMFAPINREQGYSPAWLTRVMQGTMFPYFVMYVKEKSRLENALNQIMYLQNKFSNELKVEDFHDLRNAHEIKNMLVNAEMKLRAGLAREESRGTHFREDFPYRDDKNNLNWIKLVQKDGKMTVVKHPIPEKWHPAPSLKYRDKYHAQYPHEDEMRAAAGIND
jgi:succinate dehydrogenase/fumarate reductase flavoprotein subunit